MTTKNAPQYAVVLAAGKGSRMGSATTHKVCFEVDGVPAINRALDIYRDLGVMQNLVVVGQLATQVMETVTSEFPNTSFAFQREATGTAGAVRAALNATPVMLDNSNVLVTAGDRLIHPQVLENLFHTYSHDEYDFLMITLPTVPGSGAGRVALDKDGEVAAIIEMADIRQRRVRKKLLEAANSAKELTPAAIKALLHDFSADTDKQATAFPELLSGNKGLSAEHIKTIYRPEDLLFTLIDSRGSTFTLTPDEAEKLPNSNTSVYLTRRELLQYAINELDTNNAQHEEYLSDIVAMLRRRPGTLKLGILQVNDPTKVLGFNNPKELLAVNDIIRESQHSEPPKPNEHLFIPGGEYLNIVKNAIQGEITVQLAAELEATYGIGDDWNKYLVQFQSVLELAVKTLGKNAPTAIIRSPGRVNTMGRHIDHQGGNCNLMTINFETIMAVSPRTDDRINIHHVDEEHFAPDSFAISDLIAELPWQDWDRVVNSSKLKELIGDYGVEWSHYVKAAALRLQKKYKHSKLFGMEMFVTGNIPMAAGLSSSSSLVVGAAEAVVTVNQLDTIPAQFVTLCGEGEWFVGTRGGAADHAAVKLGETGKVVKVRFFDFGIEECCDFPADHVIVIGDSGIQARKAAGAKDQFNHRVSCYRIGFELIKKKFPRYAKTLKHLRDVNCDNLGIGLAGIYTIVKQLPEHATRKELEHLLGRELSEFWNTHAEPANGDYPIRAVVLYGLAECARSAIFSTLLKQGDFDAIGRLMTASHNGDRVSATLPNGSCTPFAAACSDAELDRLIADASSVAPDRRESSRMEFQPGGYACSLPEIDAMVDIANSVQGVAGAQLAGAGLGGCMMVLVRKDAVDQLIHELNERYYKVQGVPPRAFFCRPIAGSGPVEIK